jgi:hypothetical protein
MIVIYHSLLFENEIRKAFDVMRAMESARMDT